MFLRAAIVICCLGFLDAVCQNGWIRFENSCYLFSRLTFNFADAEQFCNQHNGYLVHIETHSENEFIRTTCKSLHATRRWIGINDLVQEGRWVWQGTDTKISFHDWYPGEPNHGAETNCGDVGARHSYHWADSVCSNLFEPICESALNSDGGIIG